MLESRGTDLATIARLAGKGSPLHSQHKVYVDVVTIADVPDVDVRRYPILIDMNVGGLRGILSGSQAFERHDLRARDASRGPLIVERKT